MERTQVKSTTLQLSETSKRYLGLISLELWFASIVLLVARFGSLPQLTPLMLVLFSLATFRLARTISFNEIAEPLRAPFTTVEKDSCGAGDNVHPAGGGIMYAIGSLISCPICTGVWSALMLYTLYTFWTPVGTVLVYVLAFAGASEIIHYGACTLEWGGRAARVYSGKISPDKE